MADELHRLLLAGGIEPPFLLVGHSLGGYTTRIYQRRYAAEVSGLVLVESGHPDQWRRLPAGVLAAVEGAAPLFEGMAAAAETGELTPEHLDPWPFSRQGKDQRAAYERAMLTAKPYATTGAEFAAVLESAEAVPEGRLGDLPLVVVTAARSFDAFQGSGMPIEESNPVWLELQRELVGLSSNGEQLVSETGDHNLEQSDPEIVVAGIRRGLALARARPVHR
jgi:pimeloyl-ACP methyl ester carboxylesterase